MTPDIKNDINKDIKNAKVKNSYFLGITTAPFQSSLLYNDIINHFLILKNFI
jgi:hypothetical protein